MSKTKGQLEAEISVFIKAFEREHMGRGAKFLPDQLKPARCPLLGYALYSMQIEGMPIPRWFLEVNTQPEVGDEAYDHGARAGGLLRAAT